MTDEVEETDPYPVFSKENMQWFVALLESMVDDPDLIVGVGRVRGGNDLELIFKINPSVRSVFTDEVCLDLERQVKERTGMLGNPVIYDYDNPSSRALQAIAGAVY